MTENQVSGLLIATTMNKEDVVGWYSTCPKLRENDLAVHASIFRSCSYVLNPVVLVTIECDVHHQEHGIPTEAYYQFVGSSKETFVPVPTEIAPPEVEEIGGTVLVTEMTPGGDNGLLDSIESYYHSMVRISVSGYDTSLDTRVLVDHLVKHFESCGSVKNVQVPRHPVTNAITGGCTTVILHGEGAAEKALALNGTDAGGWIVSVALLPSEVREMASGMSAREYAIRYVADLVRVAASPSFTLSSVSTISISFFCLLCRHSILNHWI
ncbi:26S proteasome non-ATPase regulatory subunit 7-like [Raphanus sativus]|nr:26S proteasome non-ATPase regulatory subunit 7-like [Raphanus sativus]